MSRIGKQPIPIPERTEVKIGGNLVIVKGPKGELSYSLPPKIKAEIKDGKIFISPVDKSGLSDRRTLAFFGTARASLFNMVKGVKDGYEKRLEIQGVGYKVSLQGSDLILNLGYSHHIEIKPPKGIEFKTEKNIIVVSGIDKELVGQVAAKIRSQRKPEPYKGKGIRYQGEIVKIKAGKKAVSTET